MNCGLFLSKEQMMFVLLGGRVRCIYRGLWPGEEWSADLVGPNCEFDEMWLAKGVEK